MASGVLGDEEVQKILIDMLPVEAQNPAELEATVRSPQFRQTLASLTNALQTENYNSIFANFSLDTSAGAAALAQGNTRRVVAAMKMNDRSSRGHAIFTIYVKQILAAGGEREGKLNLVDLAGAPMRSG